MQAVSKVLGWSKEEHGSATVPTKGNADDKITIVSFPPHTKLHSSATPFGIKVEIMLRMASLEYEGWNGNVQDKKVAPKLKFPVLYHGSNVVPDSGAIVKYLHNTYPDKMSMFIPKEAKSVALAKVCRRSLEEHTYFGLMYMIWQIEENFKQMGPIIFSHLPAALRSFIMSMARGSVIRDLKGQGIGRHSPAEVMQKLQEDFDSYSSLISESGAYLTGSTPTAADCFLWGLLDMCKNTANCLEKSGELVALVDTRPPLVDFYDRIKNKVFPDGPSTAWNVGMFDPKAHCHSAASSGAATQ